MTPTGGDERHGIDGHRGDWTRHRHGGEHRRALPVGRRADPPGPPPRAARCGRPRASRSCSAPSARSPASSVPPSRAASAGSPCGSGGSTPTAASRAGRCGSSRWTTAPTRASTPAAMRRLILEEDVVAFIGNIAPFTFSAGRPDPRGGGRRRPSGARAPTGRGSTRPWPSRSTARTISRSRPAAKWALANLPQRKAAVLFVSEADAPRELAGNFADEWRGAAGRSSRTPACPWRRPTSPARWCRPRTAGADIMFVLLEKAACNRFFDATQRQGYAPIIIAPACVLQNMLDHKGVATNKVYAAARREARARRSQPRGGRGPRRRQALRPVPRPSTAPSCSAGWRANCSRPRMAQPGTTLTPRGIVDALHKPAGHRPRRAHPGAGLGARATTPRGGAG